MTSTSAAAGLPAPRLHRLIAAGHLRYWIIAAWALPLWATASWRVALAWFVVTTALGLVRTLVESRLTGRDAGSLARLKLAVATVSCTAWAGAPLLAILYGGSLGPTVAVALLGAGYTLVFTQMRAAPREALIVSTPYTVLVIGLIAGLWGTPGFWIALSVVPVVGMALLIKVVITQMKDSELSAVNLAQAALIEDLAAARDRADAANAAKSRFLGVMSHELRTPMNGVLGAAQVLQTTGLNTRQTDMVEVILSSGDNLMALLNDILDVTKIEAERMTLDQEIVDTHGLVERLIGPFRAQAEARGVGFVAETRGVLPATLTLDPLRLSQITHNLLGNAIKFTEAGTVTLTVTGTPGDDGRSTLEISVADTGIGITAADIDSLFQPFVQVDGSSTRRFGGTGLGLTICRKLAGLMDGDITVRSVPGEGSVFTFRAVFEHGGSERQSAAA
ncbi:ATP-binding protein [uncultured Brevundimonas sp.]|uniref:sensor histidine kinase n=1 Tax=uncultured Brevundimonas sp. TaxID=213418 RepID=UPI0030ED9A8B|tara:strand:- start:292 stop:1635 length:1344 start_codon:yes stop_codon:yes gene_type:complete